MMKFRRITGAVVFAAALMLTGITAFAANVPVEWSNLTLTTDSASWNMDVIPPNSGEQYVVQRYELRLSRMHGGVWKENFRTVHSQGDDTSYDITYSSVGQYKFAIRALFYGGLYSDWSDASGSAEGINVSNVCVVTRDDISVNPGGGGGTGPNSNPGGPGVVPGANPSTPTANNGQSGWVRSGDSWYYKFANSTYAKNGWQLLDGKWYYFNADGVMQVGWVWYQNNWYLCLPTGEMATGWNNVNEKWYYLNENGVMQTGYIVINGQTFYCDATGARIQNGGSPDGHYFDGNGVMIR